MTKYVNSLMKNKYFKFEKFVQHTFFFIVRKLYLRNQTLIQSFQVTNISLVYHTKIKVIKAKTMRNLYFVAKNSESLFPEHTCYVTYVFILLFVIKCYLYSFNLRHINTTLKMIQPNC